MYTFLADADYIEVNFNLEGDQLYNDWTVEIIHDDNNRVERVRFYQIDPDDNSVVAGDGWSFTMEQRRMAVTTTDCPYCGQKAGRWCVMVRGRKNQYNQYVHKDRLIKAGV